MVTSKFTTDEIRKWLKDVMDPEIPTLSIIDLGIITEIKINDSTNKVEIEMIPTFSGCPAIDFMKFQIEKVLSDHGVDDFEVNVNRNKSWSSEMLTEKGRQDLLDFGLSPPPRISSEVSENDLNNALCPNCHSNDTKLMTPFGPTLCRAIHHCTQCSETFEQFKPL